MHDLLFAHRRNLPQHAERFLGFLRVDLVQGEARVRSYDLEYRGLRVHRVVFPVAVAIIVLAVVTIVVNVLKIPTALVSSIATIPNGLPQFMLPNFSLVPQLALGAVSVSIVALAQAARMRGVAAGCAAGYLRSAASSISTA